MFGITAQMGLRRLSYAPYSRPLPTEEPPRFTHMRGAASKIFTFMHGCNIACAGAACPTATDGNHHE